jgi:hypothetical protein
MILEKTRPDQAGTQPAQAVINNFSITISTLNGSGSQTSNLTLMRALFGMGIPVSGKNIPGTAYLVHHPGE